MWVAGAGPAHRELVAQIFHRALTELLPPAVSFPLAAEAIRQSAADLAPDTVVEREVEQALEAVGLPPLHTAGRGDATAERGDASAHPDGGAGERRSGHSPAYAALPSKPSATAGRPADFDVQATQIGHYNYESPHSNPVALLPDGSLLYAANTPADSVDVIDTATRTVVARVDVGIDPVGVAVRPDGREVWVANHVSDSVSVIDAEPASPTRHHVLATVQVFDAATRSTRFDEPVGIAFAGNAKAYVALSSSNRVAVVDVASRAVTTFLPITAQDIRTPIGPNCDCDVPESCTGHLVDGSLATTMCDLADCETNDEGKLGRLSGAERAAMAEYLLSVPYPPSPERPYTNELTARARLGINEFHVTKQCGNCHRLPFRTTTNMGGSGMDVSSWRGANDRWKNAPQNRFFFADRVRDDRRGFPERFGFVNDQEMFQMIVEGSVGFSGALGRQLTLNPDTVSRPDVADLLDALEQSASEGGIVLHATGILLGGDLPFPFQTGPRPLSLFYRAGAYRADNGRPLAPGGCSTSPRQATCC